MRRRQNETSGLLRSREKTQLLEHDVSNRGDGRRSFTFCDSNDESNNQGAGSKDDSTNQAASMDNFCEVIKCKSTSTRANLILCFLQQLDHKEDSSLQHFGTAFVGKPCCRGNTGAAARRVCNLCLQAERAFCGACYQRHDCSDGQPFPS